MKALILAAGYATRLYPLTKNQPKPLLEVSGKSILDFIVEKIEKVDSVDEVIVITNEKFTPHFEEWAEAADYSKQLTIVNDGTTTNDNRLGAIGDIQFVIEEQDVQDDLLILAGDNLFDFELTDFVDYFNEVDTEVITAYEEKNEDQLKRAGIVELDENGRVQSFEEKPDQPKSNYAVPAFYIYKKETLPRINDYLEADNDPDAPGHFIPYLLNKELVHAYLFEGNRYDIGTLESYERIQKLFADK